ncbi:MAG: ATP-dependent sacrificial sulfur transferase LarE [Desulfomonile tiedjei]|nr:ATP-dependent sacrificial sulfur transferase LarE [Desulfomonile tiedjei]
MARSTGIERKEQLLREIIGRVAASEANGRVIIGFSGGVDSSLLLWETVQTLGPDRVVAVTATSPTSIPEEEYAARIFAHGLNVEHLVIPTDECEDPSFVRNPPDRCYVCKSIRYRSLQSLARRLGCAALFDGTQSDDDPADRPGMRALEELGIGTPLADAGLTKEEIREILREEGFHDLAEKQAQPCLATRIAAGAPITVEALEIVQRGESVLRTYGLGLIRLRIHGSLGRVVTDEAGISTILQRKEIRQEIVSRLTALGLTSVTLDLRPYGEKP